MSVAKNIRIFESEVQPVRIDELKIVETELQSRAETDPEIVAIYAERRRGKPKQPGTPFPPVLVFIIDSVWWLVDGFHRVRAAQKLREETIPAIVRHGTMLDALLAGAAINMSKENLRGYQEDDRWRFAELLIRCGAEKPGEGSWDWSDTEIAHHCNVSRTAIKRLRIKLREEKKIAIPFKIWTFKGGRKTGRQEKYMKGNFASGTNTISLRDKQNKAMRFAVGKKGSKIDLGADFADANARYQSIVQQLIATRNSIDNGQFGLWLARRGIHAISFISNIARGYKVADALVIDDNNPGGGLMRVLSTRYYFPTTPRIILVGLFDELSRQSFSVFQSACTALSWLEVMDPFEFAAAFGGTLDPSDSIDADGPDAPPPDAEEAGS